MMTSLKRKQERAAPRRCGAGKINLSDFGCTAICWICLGALIPTVVVLLGAHFDLNLIYCAVWTEISD
jgi:hypothetical protein